MVSSYKRNGVKFALRMTNEASQNQASTSPSLVPTIEPKKRERVWEIDFLRGAAILGMVIDHFLFDLGALDTYFVNFHEIASPALVAFSSQMHAYFYGPIRQFFHSLAFLFFLMSGISCSFSRSNFRHAGKILLCAGLFTVFTYSLYFISNGLGSPVDIRIIFGVLFVLGIGVLLVAIIQLLPGAKWIELGLGSAILLFGVLWGFLGPTRIQFTDFKSFVSQVFYVLDVTPEVHMYKVSEAPNWFALVTGFDVPTFFASMFGFARAGTDYFPMIPWIGFTLIGAFLGQTLYKEKKSLLPQIDGIWRRPVDWFGSKSLYVYVLHQPFWLLVLILIFLPMGFRMF